MKRPSRRRSQRTVTKRPGHSATRGRLLSLEPLEERRLLVTVPNAGFEERATLDEDANTPGIQPMPDGFDRYNQWALESWRHFEVDNNGGPLRIWNPGDPANPAHLGVVGVADVGFGGNAPEGDYVVVVRSRYNDDEFHDPPQVRDFEAATQLLTETFDPAMTYTLTAKVGRLPETAEGGSDNYDPSWYGYALQLAVGGINGGSARFQGWVEGGTVIAQDWNSLTVPANEFVTSTVTYTPDPAHADLAGLPLQIRLAALEDPDDHSLTGWVAFDDVQLSAGAIDDTTAPVVTGFELNAGFTDPPDLPTIMQPSSWDLQRSDIRNIAITFNEFINGGVTADDLALRSLGVNGDEDIGVDLGDITVEGDVVTITFDQALPDGVLELTVHATVQDLAGNALDGNGDGVGGDAYVLRGESTNGFHKLTGNWNGDLGVSIFDFPTLAYWFGQPVPSIAPEYMDLNQDDGVSIFDFPVFANNFGGGLTFPTPGLRHDPADEFVLGATRQTLDANPFRRRTDETARQRDIAPANDAALMLLLAQWNQRPTILNDHGAEDLGQARRDQDDKDHAGADVFA